jgi:hypothetical protein
MIFYLRNKTFFAEIIFNLSSFMGKTKKFESETNGQMSRVVTSGGCDYNFFTLGLNCNFHNSFLHFCFSHSLSMSTLDQSCLFSPEDYN